MADVFINGGLPGYSGVQIDSGQAYLEDLRDGLISAGWILEFDDIVSNSLFEARCDTPELFQAFYRFQLVSPLQYGNTCLRERRAAGNSPGGGNPNSFSGQATPASQFQWASWQDTHTSFADLQLRVIASQDSGFSTTSRDLYGMPVFLGITRYWLCANAESFVLCHGQPYSHFASCAIYGGWQERIIDTDGFAYGIGYCNTDPCVHEIAKSAFDGFTNWYPIGRMTITKNSATNTGNSQYRNELTWWNDDNIAPLNMGLMDRFTSSCCITGADYYDYADSQTIGKHYWMGANNALDNTYVLGKAFLIEGKINPGDYVYSGLGIDSFPFYFRGWLQNVQTGMAQAMPFIKVQDCDDDSIIYMSVGGPGHLAMRIA